MSEPRPPEGGDQAEAPTPLLSAFLGAMEGRAERSAPSDVGRAVERYGWSTRDLARELGVSERTARRYRQQDRIPDRRAARWREVVKSEATARQRERIERRGLTRMDVTGTYEISAGRRRFRANRNAPVRFVQGRITGAQMRDVFGALDRGEAGEAETLLNGALADAYGAGGLVVTEVEGLDYST